MKAQLLVTALIGAFLLPPMPIQAAQAHFVSCAVFAPGVHCADPILQGMVDGQWVGLILHYNGTNGGPDRIAVVSIGLGGNGESTLVLPTIKPVGASGDRMNASFREGKLFIWNAVYLPGEAHCCYTHIAVRRFGFHGKKLQMEREATVPNNATAAAIDAALEHGAHF